MGRIEDMALASAEKLADKLFKEEEAQNKSNKSKERGTKVTKELVDANSQLEMMISRLVKEQEALNKISEKYGVDVQLSSKAVKSLRGQIEALDLFKMKEQVKIAKEKIKTDKLERGQMEALDLLRMKERNDLQAKLDQEHKLREAESKRFEQIQSMAIAEDKARDSKKNLDEQKKRTAQIKKESQALQQNQQKLKLLLDTAKHYGVEVKSISGSSDMMKKALKGDKVAFQQLSRAIKQASKTTEKYKQHTRNLHGSISVIRSKLLLFSFAVGGSIRFVKQFTEASKEQEIAVKRVSNVIKSQGYISGLTTKQVRNYASALQETTGVTDEVILKSSQLLLSFSSINKDIFKEAQRTALDMTAGLNAGAISTETLKTQTMALGKALEDPVKGMASLRRMGTTFNAETKTLITTLVEEGKVLEAQKILLQEINKQYGGNASIDSYELSQRALESAMGDTAETIGFILQPALKEASDRTTEFLKSLDPNQIAKAGKQITALVTSIGTYLIIAPRLILMTQKVWYGFKKMRQEGLALESLGIFGGGKGKMLKTALKFLTKLGLATATYYGTQKALDNLGSGYWDDFNESIENAQSVKRLDLLTEGLSTLDAVNLSRIKREINEFGLSVVKIEGDSKGLVLFPEQLKDIEVAIARLNSNKITQIIPTPDEAVVKKEKDKFKDIIDNLKSQVLEYNLLKGAVSDLDKMKIKLKATNEQLTLSGIDITKITKEQRDTLESLIAQRLVQLNIDEDALQKEKDRLELIDYDIQKQAEISKLQEENKNLRLRGIEEIAEATFSFIQQKRDMELQLSLDSISRERELINQTVKNEAEKERRLKELNVKEANIKRDAHNKSINLQMLQLASSSAMAIAEIYMKFEVAKATALATFPTGGGAIVALLEAQKNISLLTTGGASAIGLAGLQAQKYETGGLIGGKRHSQGGTLIEAEQGEYMMSRNAVKNYGIAGMEAINNGSAPLNITFNNPIMTEDYTEDIIIPQIRRAVQRGADIGVS